jgi:TolA-binding protein
MKEFPSLTRILLVGFLLMAASPAYHLRAQTGAPEKEAAAALELFNNGQNAEAAAAYEKIVKDYPTSTVVAESTFRLGFLDYLMGDYDKAIVQLQKVAGPPAQPEIQELAANLMPQALAALASKLSDTDPKRNAAYEDAIKAFDSFIQKYPASGEMEGAIYGRALARYQIQKYDEAVADLNQNIAKFPKSESILESEYLLALTLATQGKYEESEKWMNDIVQKHTDVALANEAQFQIGEILFNQGTKAPESAKQIFYNRAMAAYRAVEPKDLMIKVQQARLTAILQRLREAGSRGDAVGFKKLQRFQEHEFEKMALIKGKPDATVSAQIKAGALFFIQKKYDESRVLLSQMQQFAEDDALKKQALYYIALSYASQNIADKAVAAYNEFQSKYKADPMADNLPVAVGVMFLSPTLNNPDKAIEYFKEAQQIYPKGRLASETVTQEAAALLLLKRFDEALKVYTDFLATNPKPELAAQAELGLAGINKETGKLEEAGNGYKNVRDKYPGTPEAEQAAFWVGQLAQMRGDTKTSIPELTAFVSKYPDSTLRSPALFSLALGQLATGAKDQALATFSEITQKYPKSEAAIYVYFQRAAIYAADQKTDEMVATMKEFIEKYPQSDKIYFAYDTIGGSQINASKIQDAIATYSAFLEKQPQSAQVPDGLLKVSTLWLEYAKRQGLYIALNEQQRAEWSKGISGSMESAAKLVENYPDDKSVALALQNELEAQKLLLGAKLKTDAELEKFFLDQAQKFDSKPAAKSKTLFALAAYISEKDKARALDEMNKAFDAKLVYAPADIDLYGSLLIENGKLDEAQKLFEKVAVDYPNPPGATPDKATQQVQEAQAISIYGLGKTLQKQGNVAGAAEQFDKLKKLYPWSPKILEANFGIAQSLAQQKKLDDATTLLVAIIRAQTATAELRANSMLLGGDIQIEKGNLEAAIDYYIKIATFYEGVPTAASEGLWKGGQLLEKQAATLTETGKPKKSEQMAKAIKAYKDLIEKYPSSPFAAQAKERLQQLNAQ